MLLLFEETYNPAQVDPEASQLQRERSAVVKFEQARRQHSAFYKIRKMPEHIALTPFFNRLTLAALCVLLFLTTSGCGEPVTRPEGPLVNPSADVDGNAKRFVISDNDVTLEHVELNETIATPSKTIVVDFGARWCGPCQMLVPELEQVAIAKKDEVIVVKVDIDTEVDVAQHFEVSGIPDIRIFRDGKAVDTLYGFHSADEILGRLP